MTLKQVRARLKEWMAGRSLRDAAAVLGVSHQYIKDVLDGAAPNEALCSGIGVQKIERPAEYRSLK